VLPHTSSPILAVLGSRSTNFEGERIGGLAGHGRLAPGSVRLRPGTETVKDFPRSHFAQPVLMYALMGLTPVLNFVVGGNNTLVTDAAGVVWQTRSIAESHATVSIYTMLFVVALSAVNLIQKPATVTETSVQLRTPVTREVYQVR